MDSQENVLLNEEQSEVKNVEETVVNEPVAEEPQAPVEEPEARVAEEPQAPVTEEPAEESQTPDAEEPQAPVAEEPKVYKTKAEVIERIKELAHGDEAPSKEQYSINCILPSAKPT